MAENLSSVDQRAAVLIAVQAAAGKAQGAVSLTEVEKEYWAAPVWASWMEGKQHKHVSRRMVLNYLHQLQMLGFVRIERSFRGRFGQRNVITLLHSAPGEWKNVRDAVMQGHGGALA